MASSHSKRKNRQSTRKLNPGLDSPESGEVWINNTLPQGDSFFSALYRALKERDLLGTVVHNLPNLRGSTELRFISSFRNLIADEILADRLPFTLTSGGKKEDTYDFYSALGPDLGVIIAMDEVVPDWFKSAFANGVKSKKQFLKICAKAVKTRKQFVGEMEVAIAKGLLKDIGVIVEIEGLRRTALPKLRDGLPLIVLFNESGTEYEYYSFRKRCTRKNEVRSETSRMCSIRV